ncbi:cyclic nucleotide-binding-like protein [Limtongia smithiae]|uniref:cyclic nucleotide-binding-like protein n=1 Tax=Limtongia smithiae TaxID=1125753 RepID=UPI0034CDF134
MFSSSFSFQSDRRPGDLVTIDERLAPSAAPDVPADSPIPSTPAPISAPGSPAALPALSPLATGAAALPSTPSVPPLPINFNANRRTSVSGESLSPTAGSAHWRPRTIPKSPEQIERLNRIIQQNFLLRDLDDEAHNTVLAVLEEARVPAAGVTILKQGDEGEKFYMIESGAVDYFINGTKVSSSGPDSSFGELALMYNSPRAATVITTQPCVFWILDGTTFRRILMQRTASKRSMYEQFLRDVPVLAPLTAWERAKIADALKAVSFNAGDVIIKEGDVGDLFYLIEDGEAEVFKDGQGKVNQFSKGAYFGELALLNDRPRAATVVAKTHVNAVTLDKDGFNRLIGDKIVLPSY